MRPPRPALGFCAADLGQGEQGGIVERSLRLVAVAYFTPGISLTRVHYIREHVIAVSGDGPMRVLLIDDDASVSRSVELMLISEKFSVYTTDLGQEGIDLVRLYDYDIILLDLNLPDMSGFEVLRKLRTGKIRTPVLILSGLASIEDKVKGLGFGADDYLTKPFHKVELVARIQAIVRRSKGHAQSLILVGDLTVNLNQKVVEVAGSRVHLTGREYQLLELLALRKGSALTKEMFLNHLYGGMDEPDAKIIDVFICKVRKKLSNAGHGKNYIETIWGRGYMMHDGQSEPRALAS
jgi:two-component system cell cycle response regulator CtrA